jgi:hypothetical protein
MTLRKGKIGIVVNRNYPQPVQVGEYFRAYLMNKVLRVRFFVSHWHSLKLSLNSKVKYGLRLYLSSILCKYTSRNRLPSNTIFTVVVVFLQMHYIFRSTRPSSDATVHLTCFSSVMFPPPHWPVFTFLGV